MQKSFKFECKEIELKYLMEFSDLSLFWNTCGYSSMNILINVNIFFFFFLLPMGIRHCIALYVKDKSNKKCKLVEINTYSIIKE